VTLPKALMRAEGPLSALGGGGNETKHEGAHGRDDTKGAVIKKSEDTIPNFSNLKEVGRFSVHAQK